MSRAVSVKEMAALIEQISHKPVRFSYEPARPGDQLIYVSDSTRFYNQTGWVPRRSLEQTIRDISAFWHANPMRVMRAPVASRRLKSIGQAAQEAGSCGSLPA
jgi:UDP-glucose 4-epimerase